MQYKGRHLSLDRDGDSCFYKDALRMVRKDRKSMIEYLKERIADVKAYQDELGAALASLQEEKTAQVSTKGVKPKRYPPGRSEVLQQQQQRKEKRRGTG